MLIYFHISLITKRLFRSFDRHSDKTVTLTELLQGINNFGKTIVDVIRKSHEFGFIIVRVITISARIPLIFLWMPAYDVRVLPADTRWRHAFPPSRCCVHLPIFFTPWIRPSIFACFYINFARLLVSTRFLYHQIYTQLFTLILYGAGVRCDRSRFSVFSPFIEKSMDDPILISSEKYLSYFSLRIYNAFIWLNLDCSEILKKNEYLSHNERSTIIWTVNLFS